MISATAWMIQQNRSLRARWHRGRVVSAPRRAKETLVKKMLAMAFTAATLGVTLATGSASAAHPEPTTKAACMNGGFAEYKTSGMTNAPQRFKNQGQGIQFVNTGK